MRVYRYILGVLTIIFVAIGLSVVVYGISKSHLSSDTIPFAAGLLFIIYIVLQYLFLIKFGFYKENNAEQYNKKITIGVPVLIVMFLMAFIALEYQRDITSDKRNKPKVEPISGDRFTDFLDVFDYPQEIPRQLAVRYLQVGDEILESNTLWSVDDLIFSDVVTGIIYKTINAQGDEKVTFATFNGVGKLIDKIVIGYNNPSTNGKRACSYEFDSRQFIVLKHKEIRKDGTKKEIIKEVKTETYLVDENTGIISQELLSEKN
ncbi:hypothetical protein SanaruYs_35640 [Chryseotalea sanaruensis]|uniref:Uncharacterized protein n=1 Tax=Chryseotalea sanaruensis TaxID=2482724 RepID=A0A401UEI7_9BACT|nr:hypothetical protein [Chryseotalea sanaruensis]GCC53321.1 hypothetical protein SanaruYs_35640 [Chryseotalea sanaruensis]